MKILRNGLSLASLLLLAGSMAHAQNAFDVFFGVGAAHDSSNGQTIDIFGTGTPLPTPSLSNAFGKIGADVMFNSHLGVGGEGDFQFKQADYAGVNYRTTFYDFYGIWQPVHSKRITPVVEAGIGAAHLGFYYNSSYCDALAGCSSSNSYIEGSNHFQARFGLGINIYATDHLFIRPEADVHWVKNFFQFGNDWVPEYSIAVGYRFGEH